MKKIILIIPLIFSSACSSATCISECLKKDNNYINKDLIEAYNKEKTVYIDDQNYTVCILSRRCHRLTYNDRWENIEIYLKPAFGISPDKPGLYLVSRDYSFKKCLKVYSPYGENKFTDNNREFCISATPINKSSAKVKFMSYEKRYEKSSSNIISVKIIITVDNEKFIENNSVTENTRMGQSICEKNDLSEKILTNDF